MKTTYRPDALHKVVLTERVFSVSFYYRSVKTWPVLRCVGNYLNTSVTLHIRTCDRSLCVR